MQLAVLLGVILALAQSEGAAALPVGGSLWRSALVLVGVLIVPLAAAAGSLPIVTGLRREKRLPPAACQRIWSRVEATALTMWLLVVAAMLYLLEWPRLVRSDWSLGRWPLVDELLILAPVIAPLVLLWTLMHWLERTAIQALGQNANSAHENRQSPIAQSLPSYLWLHARQHLALVVIPALVVIGTQEIAAALWPQAAAGGGLQWLNLPLVGAMLLLMPLALKRLWRTTPLPDGPLRERLVAACRRQRAGVRDLLVWHTHGRSDNAAVAGLVPGLRYVLLTDGLLLRLTPHEVEAVVRHELGHVAGRHMLRRMLLLALPLAIGVAIEQQLPGTSAACSQALARLGISPAWQTAILPALFGTYALLVVGIYSKWLEHEADLATCITPAGTVDQAAAQSFGRALVKVLGRGRESGWSRWLHPPLGQRLAVLAVAVADPQSAVRFRRRLAIGGWALAGVYVLIGAILLANW